MGASAYIAWGRLLQGKNMIKGFRVRCLLDLNRLRNCVNTGNEVNAGVKCIHSSVQSIGSVLGDKEPCYDVVVVGGGIVGTSSARELLLHHPTMKLAIVEKEDSLAVHQSGHNSGVIHAGIYYKPGSLKAKLCVEGLHMSYDYFDKEGIPYKKVGKLIVATEKAEIPRLNDLFSRAIQNNVPDVKLIEGSQIKEYEPYCKGLKAIWSPHTGIVNWGLVTHHYGRNVRDLGGSIYFNFEVAGFQEASSIQPGSPPADEFPIRITSNSGKSIRCRYVLTCGGLQSDKIAELSGCSGEPHIVPFRGEYLLLKKEKAYLVKGNIYPVPDPRFPFLGVHFTPRMNGDIWLGPNAILALKREGYSWSDVSVKDFMSTVTFRGFQRLAFQYALVGANEVMRSVFSALQVRQLQRFIPELLAKDVTPGPTGVRAQALNSDGSLEDDFVFSRERGNSIHARILHCRNCPSPAATSSLAIAKMITSKLHEEFSF